MFLTGRKLFIVWGGIWLVSGLGCISSAAGLQRIGLSELDLSFMSAGWGTALKNKSIVGKSLRISGITYEKGVGTHAVSKMCLDLQHHSRRFTARVGVDDETDGKGTVRFIIYGDNQKLFDSGIMKGGDEAKPVDLSLKDINQLILLVDDGGDDINFDHADWADAMFEYQDKPPQPVGPPQEKKVILTPKPGPAPKINGPRIYGARPGHPFLFRIPTTGKRPLHFAAQNLPSTLMLDTKNGIITGTTPSRRGEYSVVFTAENSWGQARRQFRIVVGDTLALTPPMGWNSWYIHYHRVSDADMRAAADAMVASGMADYGYMYVNIDDCWMVKPSSKNPLYGGTARNPDGTIRPNGKFPDMKAMTDYIHSKGLKAGLYTSPGRLTCAGYTGAYGHEQQDAQTFAEWGFDFLKYDWCSYGRIAKDKSRPELMKPYLKMGRILQHLDRDIVFNLCQYGMGGVWKWGGAVGGNCWRTTGDLGLVGGQLSRGIYKVGLFNATLWKYARPGQWNDPDYILIGYVGRAQVQGAGRPTTLTPNEQYSHMSMWSLMAAPLIFSGDMTKLDDFTLNILCNSEVIDVDQDPLGKQAKIVTRTPDHLVLAKDMEDGSLAVGLFNLSELENNVSVSAGELNITGQRRIRDLWRQKNTGTFTDSYKVTLPRHGVQLIRLYP